MHHLKEDSKNNNKLKSHDFAQNETVVTHSEGTAFKRGELLHTSDTQQKENLLWFQVKLMRSSKAKPWKKVIFF